MAQRKWRREWIAQRPKNMRIPQKRNEDFSRRRRGRAISTQKKGPPVWSRRENG